MPHHLDVPPVARWRPERCAAARRSVTSKPSAINWLAWLSLALAGFAPLAPSPANAATPNRLVIRFATGDDDLRGGNDNLNVTLLRANGTQAQFTNVNEGESWGNGSSRTVALPLPSGSSFEDLSALQLETTGSGRGGGDSWNLDRLQVSARISDATHVLLDQGARPLVRFTSQRRAAIFRLAAPLRMRRN